MGEASENEINLCSASRNIIVGFVGVNDGKSVWLVRIVDKRSVRILHISEWGSLREGSAYLAHETGWLKPDGDLLLVKDMAIEIEEVKEQRA